MRVQLSVDKSQPFPQEKHSLGLSHAYFCLALPVNKVENVENNEFGKLSGLMRDPHVEEIWLNSPHRIFVAKAGLSELTNIVLSESEVHELVEGLLDRKSTRLNSSHT